MEVFRTKQFYIFVRETHSLWWDRETGILIPKAVWELTEAEDPICQGICEGLIGKVEHSMFEPKLLIIRESEPVGLLQENDIIHKIKSVVFIPLGSENVNLNLNSCPKHRNYCDKPISNTTSLFDVPLPKSSALTKTWGTLKNAGSSIKNTTQQAAAIASGFPKRKDKSKFERQIVEEFYKIFNDTSSFYFCRTYDITNSLQRLCDVKKTAEIHWRNADDRFFWNKHMLKELVDSNNPLFDHWIMPIIQGYIQIEECTIQLDNDIQGVAVTPKFETFKLCLISRRSRFRAGTRYNRRGVDEHGHCANYVETEQILLYQHHQASFVQVRGSVPVYWSQPGYKYRPPPRIDKGEEETKAAFSKHFDEEIMTYGPVSIVNLVEQTGKERVIWEAYTTNIIDYNSPDITYVTFDFHEYCSGMRFENVSILIDTINELIKNMNYCWKDKQGLICTQNGIFRVNCIDCLDRTNVVQTAIAKNVLEIQFCKLGLISPERMMPDNVKNKFQVLWANNGDIISKQYAGTNALKGDYTRTGERKFTGIMKDGMNSANRYYLSRFKDSTRQGTIDLMLGNSVTEELFKESKVDEEDCTVTAEHVKLLIEDCKKLLINSPETVLGSWGLINADPHIGDPSETEMDTILILTKDSYFVADYDDEVDRITKYQRVLLKDITYLECGIPESGTSFFKSQPIKHCIRLNYKVNETHGYFHMFRSTNLRFFNNMAVVIRNEEEEVESLKAICEAFVVALDICGLPAVPYKSGNKLEKRKSKIVGTDHPSSNVYFDIVGLPQLTRNVSESQLLSLKNVGTKALSNMSQQFAKLNKIGSKIRRNPTQTTTTPTEISSDSEDDTENSIFQTDSTTHSTDSFLPSVGIVMSATDDADKKSNPEIHLQACDDQSTPSNVTTKLSHSYDQVDVTTDKQRSSSQSNLPSLNISQSQSESALKLHFASPVTNVTKVLSPLTKLAKGVQHLGANLDPRRLSGGVRQVERDSEEVKKLQARWEGCRSKLIAL